jgi:hypothetical protein
LAKASPFSLFLPEKTTWALFELQPQSDQICHSNNLPPTYPIETSVLVSSFPIPVIHA